MLILKEIGVTYLGTAYQITDKYGFYAGNENVHDVPQQVIDAGREIMENGVKLGFFGVAGFDLLLDKNDDVFAIDLNFRQNGSTSMLLLQEELNSSYQKFYSYFSNGDNEHFFNTILKFVKRAYYIHYLIMMVIGLERMQLTLVLVVYGLEIQKKP